MKGKVVPRSYPYNAFLGLAAFHAKTGSRRFEFAGFGFTKSSHSTFAQPLRVYVNKDDEEPREITSADGLYSAAAELKGFKIWTNQPIGTVRAHAVLRLKPGWRDEAWSGRDLQALMTEFNRLARKQNLGTLRNPLGMLADAAKAPFLGANEVVIEVADAAAWESLQKQVGGVVQGGGVHLNSSDLKKLPAAWRLDTGKVDRLYPWRAGVTPSYFSQADAIWYPLKFSPRFSVVPGAALAVANGDLSRLSLYASCSLDDWDKVWD
ncbi:MAG: hypothetical protein HYV95_06185 [Opitutae bacterium]|nr:hypothetical protein [Opitutae bacterium]